MKEPHGERGLTLVELVVVVIVCAAVIVLLPPILRRPRSVCFRMTCGSNLSSLGKAMLIYANDYEDELPRAAGPNSAWSARIPDWKADTRAKAYAIDSIRKKSESSISSNLYLLVKYGEVEPKAFICTDDDGVTEFKPKRSDISNRKLIDLWDFGPDPPKHVSYAYHQPYSKHFLTAKSPPGMAVAADRNPWIDSPFAKARTFAKFMPDISPFYGTIADAQQGNAIAHKGDGQSVLYLDAHVKFTKRPYCGLDDDNIYTSWDGADKIRGKPAQFGSVPADPNDSLLVNDPAVPPSR